MVGFHALNRRRPKRLPDQGATIDVALNGLAWGEVLIFGTGSAIYASPPRMTLVRFFGEKWSLPVHMKNLYDRRFRFSAGGNLSGITTRELTGLFYASLALHPVRKNHKNRLSTGCLGGF